MCAEIDTAYMHTTGVSLWGEMSVCASEGMWSHVCCRFEKPPVVRKSGVKQIDIVHIDNLETEQ